MSCLTLSLAGMRQLYAPNNTFKAFDYTLYGIHVLIVSRVVDQITIRSC